MIVYINKLPLQNIVILKQYNHLSHCIIIHPLRATIHSTFYTQEIQPPKNYYLQSQEEQLECFALLTTRQKTTSNVKPF